VICTIHLFAANYHIKSTCSRPHHLIVLNTHSFLAIYFYEIEIFVAGFSKKLFLRRMLEYITSTVTCLKYR